MLTNDEKFDWLDSKKKLLWVSIVCGLFEIVNMFSILYWIGISIWNQVPYGLNEFFTLIIIAYILYLPKIETNPQNIKIKEWVNVAFMLFGTYMFYSLVWPSGFTLENMPLLIIYFWCMIACEVYRNFNYYYNRWKRLDELLAIEVLHQNIIDINREIFKLNAEEDKEDIKQYKDYIKFVEKKLKYLEDKHGR